MSQKMPSLTDSAPGITDGEAEVVAPPMQPAQGAVDQPRTPGHPHPSRSDTGDEESFPHIADYAFLSDCETNCLIAPSGSVEWLCIPRPDSPSVFTAILDRAGGFFRVGPYGVQVPAARRYLPGTLVPVSYTQIRAHET
jgi:hypothetical protein